jgi:hypothetical protein
MQERAADGAEAIRRLLAEYGRLLDLRDAKGWAALFTPDGAWSGGERYGVITGPAALAGFITREFAAAPPCVHIFGAAAITMGDEDATAWSRWMLVEQAGETLRIAMAGAYRDTLALTPEGWRFRRRDVAVDLPVGA